MVYMGSPAVFSDRPDLKRIVVPEYEWSQPMLWLLGYI